MSFLGEIADEEKAALLGGARALLFPIDWPEPFGMVVIEALSCGTPVIAWNHGSVPELIEDGVTGWIVDSEDAAVEAVDPTRRHRSASVPRGLRAAVRRRTHGPRLRADLPGTAARATARSLARAGRLITVTTDAPDAYYIVAATDGDDPETRLLKQGETFAVFDVFGDITGKGRTGPLSRWHQTSVRAFACV